MRPKCTVCGKGVKLGQGRKISVKQFEFYSRNNKHDNIDKNGTICNACRMMVNNIDRTICKQTGHCLSSNVQIFTQLVLHQTPFQELLPHLEPMLIISDFCWYCPCFLFPQNQITVATWAQHPTVRALALHCNTNQQKARVGHLD